MQTERSSAEDGILWEQIGVSTCSSRSLQPKVVEVRQSNATYLDLFSAPHDWPIILGVATKDLSSENSGAPIFL